MSSVFVWQQTQQPITHSRQDSRLHNESPRRSRGRHRLSRNRLLHQTPARLLLPRLPMPRAKIAHAAHTQDQRDAHNTDHFVDVDFHVHAPTHPLIYTRSACRRKVRSSVYSTLTCSRMKPMLILSQCMDFKTTLTELRYELKILTCIATAALVLSVLKVVYYHLSSTHNVRRIKQLLETRRPYHATSTPVSPLPKIERVPQYLSLRRRSGQGSSVMQSTSSPSPEKEQILQPHSPISRSSLKTSTAERTETSPTRRKNQIIATELLV